MYLNKTKLAKIRLDTRTFIDQLEIRLIHICRGKIWQGQYNQNDLIAGKNMVVPVGDH